MAWKPGPEALIQKAIIQWAKIALPSVLVQFSDAGSKDRGRRRFLAWLGALAGWPDLIFIGQGSSPFEVRMMALEVKSAKGRLTERQRRMLSLLATLGAYTGVARSVKDAETHAIAAGFPLHARLNG